MLLDILFPPRCFSCGLWGVYLCLRCRKLLVYVERQYCLYCGKASLLGFTHPACARNRGIDGVISVLRYKGVIRTYLKQIKYRFVKVAFPELFQSLEPDRMSLLAQLRRIDGEYVLQPVPLHPDKLRYRGFNQATYIASFFSQLVGYEVVSFVDKVVMTEAQAQLHRRSDRHTNIRGAFEVKPAYQNELQGKKIILVDDVVTTGSTVKEVGSLLKKHGASTVLVLSLARG